MRVRTTMAVAGVVALVTMLTTPGQAFLVQELEVEVSLDELPPAVRKAVDEHRGEGELRRVLKEVEGGSVVYELEMIENGKEKDVVIDSNGELVEIGREMDVASLPEPVRESLVSFAEGGRVLEVESTTREDIVTYEAVIVSPDGRLRKVRLAEDGRVLASYPS